MLNQELKVVRPGLILSILTLLFGIGMGILFGTNEDGIKDWISSEISTHPETHDQKSDDKIWRYAQRAHFHATGVSAFTLTLIMITALSNLRTGLKRLSAILIGMGGLYPLSWFSMFLLAPTIGRSAAHTSLLTETWVYVGVTSLLLGIALLFSNLLFDFGGQEQST